MLKRIKLKKKQILNSLLLKLTKAMSQSVANITSKQIYQLIKDYSNKNCLQNVGQLLYLTLCLGKL